MNIFRLLFIFFLIVPILEIYFLIKLGGIIGIFPTVILVVTTAMLGAAMLRSQGFHTMKKLQDAIARGEVPAMEIIEGPMLLVGGALLLTPGFFTDAMGFYLLIPQTRNRFAKYLLNHHFQGVEVNLGGMGKKPDSSSKNPTIEGEYKRTD